MHQFPITDVEKCITDMNPQIQCGNLHTLDVAKLAPDISLDDFERIPYTYRIPYITLDNDKFLSSFIPINRDIEIGKLLGEGAFAKAFHGKWQGKDVAVKELNLAGQSIIPRNIFQELRKEASVMR